MSIPVTVVKAREGKKSTSAVLATMKTMNIPLANSLEVTLNLSSRYSLGKVKKILKRSLAKLPLPALVVI